MRTFFLILSIIFTSLIINSCEKETPNNEWEWDDEELDTSVSDMIIAHRGASYSAPENTITAIQLGYQIGAGAVEIDIHLSLDMRIMVNHDSNTLRTAGKNFSIKDTHSSELRKLDVGSWKGDQFKGLKIPFLEEVLDIIPEGRTLVVEIKTGKEILPYLQRLIEDSPVKNQVEFISFNKDVIIEAKRAMPEIAAYWLLNSSFTGASMESAIKTANDNNLTGLNIHQTLVDETLMQKMNDAGLKVYTYTINDIERAQVLMDMSVDGITTDRPDRLLEQLR